MQNNFKECLDLVLKSEGGYVNNPADPGGMTNLGVTKRVWEEYTGHQADEKEMRNLTPEKVAPLYEQKYWRPCYGEVLPRGLDFVVFSMGVNAGPGRAVKLLQQSIGCVPDGVIGPATRGLICDSNTATLITKFSETRREYYRALKTFPIFGKGWLARVDKEEQEALNMVKNA
jgi:lysozyme family protein